MSAFFRLPKVHLFLTSFLILFLELSLIRWVSSNIRLVSYFSNLILLGSFLGLGVGLLLSRRKVDLFRFFSLPLFLLVILVLIFRVEITVMSQDIIFFKTPGENIFRFEPEVLLPIIFLLVACTFIPLAQRLGRLLKEFIPLHGYSLDIAGSLCGIAAFTLLSFFSTSAFIWFVIVGCLYLFLLFNLYNRKAVLLNSLVLLSMIASIVIVKGDTKWSPYYKIKVIPEKYGYNLLVNNSPHQFITDYRNKESFYLAPYEHFPNYNYKKVLIIGAGTGSDAAIALAKNPHIERIDAVEIDPVIADLGKKLNPNEPYKDPRVHLTITDGRSFLQNSKETYDLIIFALPDSLVLTAYENNVRLESFLFTKEAFEQAKSHLSPTGLFVLYNYFRRDWLVDKISSTLHAAFGNSPYIIKYGSLAVAATFLTGPKTEELATSSLHQQKSFPTEALPTDDWPFLYLKERIIPFFYIKFLLIIAGISLVLLFLTKPMKLATARIAVSSQHMRFFLFGAAFLLLETKSLTTFELLFGNTWLVNAGVIMGILSLVLFANWISLKRMLKPLWPIYIILITTLTVQYFAPLELFLNLPLFTRYLLASVFYFSPVFFANIIFSQLFAKDTDSDVNLGFNTAGAVFGGILEYASLVIGLKALYIVIAILYLVSLVRLTRIK